MLEVSGPLVVCWWLEGRWLEVGGVLMVGG